MVTENPFERELPDDKKVAIGKDFVIKLVDKNSGPINKMKGNIAYETTDKFPYIGVTEKLNKQVIFGQVPSKSNCYIIITLKGKNTGKSHGSLAKTAALKKYEQDFFIQCNHYRNAGINEYFSIEMDVYYPNQRSDLDNSLKIVLDCLQKVGAITNDNLCTRIVCNKFLDKLNPRIEFTLTKSQKQ